MTPQNSENTFVRKAREALEAASERLDADTRLRLRRIRQQALQSVDGSRVRLPSRTGMRWLAGAAATAGVAAAIYFSVVPAPVELASPSVADDLEIVALADPLDLIDEIEFYAWLAETDDGDV
jgi:hypothetical protein